ncbi:MAG TPA: lanthionine synthetase C family protein [Streptosporangiaceae bacterium]
MAREVAARAADPGRISAALAAARSQSRFPQSLSWEPYWVGAGDAGLAVFCAQLDACLPGDGWDEAGHGFLAAAVRGAERASPLPVGLFGGLSGVAFAAASLSRGGERYRRLLAALDAELAPGAAGLGARLRERREPGGVSEFDVISGASGLGAYLLRRDPHGVLPEVLGGLVSLAKPLDGPPRWMTPPQQLDDESMARWYPWGNLNCGLAHGIPGPLALLALALRRGVEVPGQAEAVRRLADWLAGHSAGDQWGVNWPTAVPLSPAGEPDPGRTGLGPSRSAWCYGSPGVARALWLAGEALEDAGLRDLAVETVRAVLRRPVPDRHIDSPTFCHGVAGLLQIVLRFAHDTGSADLAAGAAGLTDQLLAAYEPDRPLGYAALEPGSNPVDRAGLLDGAPGVAVTLFAAATDVEPAWDRLFLLS